jgi:leucyl-tRNA synthetase
LARAKKEDWPIFEGDRMEHNTMPGWAGSSWYFLRYMDPKNTELPVSLEKANYWGAVDLYIGGAEHATGHLLYSRFWTKFLCDRGYIDFDEPFGKMINQGMILGRSLILYRLNFGYKPDDNSENALPEILVSKCFKNPSSLDEYGQELLVKLIGEKLNEFNQLNATNFGINDRKHLINAQVTRQHIDVDLEKDGVVDEAEVKKWLRREVILIPEEDGRIIGDHEVEKMSKRWFNVVTPDALCDQYGADTLRMYEMFLGPVEQSKPWDTQGISGVHNFLRKFWRLLHDGEGNVVLNEDAPTKKEMQTLHRCIKKVTDDLDRLSWNTVVSTLMIAVNELTALKSNNKQVLETLAILISPYGPHFSEEIWEKLGNSDSVLKQPWPTFEAKYLEEDEFEYPVSFNGKMRFKMALAADMPKEEVEKAVLNSAEAAKYLEGKTPKKVIVVPKRIVNVVI